MSPQHRFFATIRVTVMMVTAFCGVLVQCESVNQPLPLQSSSMSQNKSSTSLVDAEALSTLLPTTSLYNKTAIKTYLKQNAKYSLAKAARAKLLPGTIDWQCPDIPKNQNLECGCDIPHTLRCSGNIHGMEQLAQGLRDSPYSVSLLDCTLINVTFLSDAKIFENVSLHGLVISSGEIKRVHRFAFMGMKSNLEALGLPNNALSNVPWNSLSPLTMLDRLDLSSNRIKQLGSADFATLEKLTYLEMSENHITTISPRAFSNLKRLLYLKLNGNRLGNFPTSLQSIGLCKGLLELDLKANSIKGPFTRDLLPPLPSLNALALDKNLITNIQNKALENFPHLRTLSLRHNQIDVLQDHAFLGLSSLQILDLGYNGIVAISGASLQHLPNLIVLDMTHNFLRTLTSDIILPLPSISEIRLDGNDIAMIESNALEKATGKLNLSLQDNPLACDCNLQPFAEWLKNASAKHQDVMGAVCATPPHLEGAPLLQVQVESLTCAASSDDDLFDTPMASQQLEEISKRSDLSEIKDVSDKVLLKKIDLSSDYSLLLKWKISLENFVCDAIFIYKEESVNEILLDHVPIQCQLPSAEHENTIIVHLADSSALIIGDNYRFCLVLIEEVLVDKTELVVGCSNITKLRASYEHSINAIKKISAPSGKTTTTTEMPPSLDQNQMKTDQSIEFLYKSLLAVVGLGLLCFSILLLIWRISKLRSIRSVPHSLPRYTVGDSSGSNAMKPSDSPHSKYFKLQATTSL